MDQLIASVTLALVLLVLVLRDVLVDHARVVQATSSEEAHAERALVVCDDDVRTGPGPSAQDEAAA
jgi:hypothetical protein